MKKTVLLIIISLIGINTFSQTFKSNSATIRKGGFEIDRQSGQ
ncbi:MAG: hypothetical protein U5L72_11565 [Bacteroidales bacterium]|nr:hypothetical protein [Bacteroidales bacterium]